MEIVGNNAPVSTREPLKAEAGAHEAERTSLLDASKRTQSACREAVPRGTANRNLFTQK